MKEAERSNSYWRKKLTPWQYHILRERGTETPFTGKLLHNKEKGVYVCSGCGSPLFDSGVKFDSGTGWPSFYDVKKCAVRLVEDRSFGMKRVEVVCAKCSGHLGHLFDDGPTGRRYCINSVALDFRKK